MRRWTSRLLGLIPAAFIAAILALRAWDPAPVQLLRDLAFDTYQRTKPRRQDVAESLVRIVDLDDESLARLGQWPWPRTLVAKLVDTLTEAKVAVIGFDIVFAEPDRLSPGRLVRTWPRTPETEQLLAKADQLPDNDRILAEAIARSRVVTGFFITPQGGRPPALKAGYGIAGANPLHALFGGLGAVATLPALEAAAKGNGALNWIPGRDLVVRRVPAVMRVGDQIYPTLFAELLRVGQGAQSYKIRAVQNGAAIEAIQIGRAAVPTDAEGRLVVYFARRDPARSIPAWKILAGDFKPADLEGRIIIVGTSAAGLLDIRATPLNPATPGVEVHAQAIEQVVAGTYLMRPDFSDGLEQLFVFLLCTGVMLLVPRIGAAWTSLIGLGGAALAIGLAWMAFERFGWLLDPVYPTLALGLVFVVTTLIVYFRTERERRQVRSAFGRYLAPALVERLAADPSHLKLGGEMRPMTLLFSDIRGFTTLSERFDAEGLTSFMNRYLTPMTDAILASGGTVDKYMGDAIMAFWNAPLNDQAHARSACGAALAMLERLKALNADLEAEARKVGRQHFPIAIGIGLNSAVCCVGNMGSQQRFDYSVLGDGVNLASRLEGQTKAYGVAVLIGEETRSLAPEFAAIEVDLIRVKGKTAPTRVYALLGGPERAQTDAFKAIDAYQASFLVAYRAAEWDAAERALEQLRASGGPELAGLCAVYADRLAAFRHHPPPAGWDGVYVAESK
ncbi:MAG: adenylate/guanylate cyclase domain-containing protein [Rhodospirillaceae bacterium]|nr:adenylate/guanylate cyclase domain-containing protein [Rhodospirillaceae bacterium]